MDPVEKCSEGAEEVEVVVSEGVEAEDSSEDTDISHIE